MNIVSESYSEIELDDLESQSDSVATVNTDVVSVFDSDDEDVNKPNLKDKSCFKGIDLECRTLSFLIGIYVMLMGLIIYGVIISSKY